MMKLTLGGCKNCTSLPTLGGLPSLEVLCIQGMDKVESIGDEFYGECMINPAFASLKELQFENMPKWESWSHYSLMMRKNMRVFPKLVKLELRKCRKLKGESPKWLQSLVKLEVSECPELVMWRGDEEEVDLGSLATTQLANISRLDCLRMGQTLRSMESLTELVINNCEGLTCLWEEREQGQGVLLLGNLKILRITNCANLEKLPNGMQISVMTRLEELKIQTCPKLESFPETGLPLTLRSLKVMDCKNLKGLPRNFNSCALEFLEIEDCESLKFFPTGTGTGELQLQLPSTLKRLEIQRCSNLESISEMTMCPNNSVLEYIELWDCPNLRTLLPECLSSLKELHLCSCDRLECFPATDLGLSTPNLAVLSISGCQNLKSMPHQMRNLKSLVRLSIFYCPGLESFPEGGSSPNLTSLQVGRCKNLKTPISDWGLQSLTSLSELTIMDMFPDMISFPEDEQCLLPSSSLSSLTLTHMGSLTSLSLPKLHSLTSLEVYEMKSLSALPLQNLTSLQSLHISYCPKLRSLEWLPSTLQTLGILRCPKLRYLGLLPSTLETLDIFRCPIIKKRYLKGKGDDFAHIPFIQIDGKEHIRSLKYKEWKLNSIF